MREDIPFATTLSKISFPVLQKLVALVAGSAPFTPNISNISSDLGISRETFVVNQLKEMHNLSATPHGDILIDGKHILEIGGRNKKTDKTKGKEKIYTIKDGIEYGSHNAIPLWLFGFLY